MANYPSFVFQSVVVLFDGCIGVLIALLYFYFLVYLVRSKRAIDWLSSASPADVTTYWNVLLGLLVGPSFFATILLAPFFLRFLITGFNETEFPDFREQNPTKFDHTFLTLRLPRSLDSCILSGILFVVGATSTLPLGIFPALLAGIVVGPIFALFCLPVVLVSGAIFGTINGVLVMQGVKAVPNQPDS